MKIKLDTTLERDMDLLIMEEFISSAEFAKIFLDAAGVHGEYVIEEATHSKRDAELGESDIVFVLNINGNRHAIHIENKIGAIAMQNQRNRYTQRAEKDIANGKYDAFSVLIVAPSKYLAVNKEARKYENQVSYEKIYGYFTAQNDIRSKYKCALTERAILEQKNGYQWEANPNVVRFCTAMDAYQKMHYSGLPMGTQAWWRQYSTVLPDAKIVYKANKGFCDLQFRQCTKQELFLRVKDHLTERMTVEKAAKSASVRVVVPPVWFGTRFEDKIKEVDEALEAIFELYALSKKLLKERG